LQVSRVLSEQPTQPPAPVPGYDAERFLAKGAYGQGWLVLPHAGVGLSAADVQQIITQGINEANKVRAQIRLPLGSRTRIVFAMADSTGEVLGLYRMPDATIFSIDLAVAKARNVAYYDNPAQLQPIDEIAGLPPGVAFTNRTLRYTAQPRYPEGIDGTAPGPHQRAERTQRKPMWLAALSGGEPSREPGR
jgi:hypothetical protein